MLPRNLRPTRLSYRIEPFDSDQSIFELKIDGFRALAYIEAGRGEMISRNGNTFRAFLISLHGSLNICAWKAGLPRVDAALG
jgi:bifunctional non-homologous end joining protein LigD